MTTLKRILGWWAIYASIAWLLAMTMALPPRIAGGYSIGAALGSALASYFPMMTLNLLPALLVLAIGAIVIERYPEWEASDIRLVTSSGVMATLVALGFGLLGVNPSFAWRTGSYLGDAAQATIANLAVAWLCILIARLVMRSTTPSPTRSLASTGS